MKIRTRSYESRRLFIGGSSARIIIGFEEAARLRVFRETRGDAEPEGHSGKPHAFQPCDCPSAKLSASPVRAAHANSSPRWPGTLRGRSPLDADAGIDLEDRADHLDNVLPRSPVYLTVILDDTAQNVHGRLDLRDAEGVLADLSSDVTGAIQRAADDMAGRPA